MKVAAVVHVFYPEFWEEVARCLRAIGNCDLFVTYVDETAVAAARRDFPSATFVECENRGYDVWPFLKVVQDLPLDDYDVLVKLHTKRDVGGELLCLNHAWLGGGAWRRHLLAFAATPEAWRRTLRRLEDPRVGMVADRHVVFRRGDLPAKLDGSFDRARAELTRLTGRDVPADAQYVAGTMFAVRPSVLKPLFAHRLSADAFEPPAGHRVETRAHLVERIFGFLVSNAGLEIAAWNGSLGWRRAYYGRTLFGRLCRAVYSRKFREGTCVTDVLGIPVRRRQLPSVSERTGRILLVSHELSVTGAPNSLLRQARYFVAAGYRVDVWALRGGALEARYREVGLTPELVPDDRQSIRRRYESDPVRYDLVVCNTIRTFRAVDVFRRYALKVVWFVRETLLLDEDHWLDPDFAALFDGFDNLYTVSDYAADVVRAYNPHVRVIRNSVADVFAGFAPPSPDVRFGYIGSIMRAKGVEVLLSAFRQARRKFPRVTLTIAGGSDRDDFAKLRAQTAGDASVRWLGEVQKEGKQAFFDGIDVLCVPSLDEPSGLTVIEGAMQGKAVVTTDRTGANYLVDGTNGRIVTAGDVESLADALMALAALKPEEIAACGRRSRALYLAAGTGEVERAAVLRMVDESQPEPPVSAPLRDERATPWFHAAHYRDGRSRWYFRNLRLFTFTGKGIRRR